MAARSGWASFRVSFSLRRQSHLFPSTGKLFHAHSHPTPAFAYCQALADAHHYPDADALSHTHTLADAHGNPYASRHELPHKDRYSLSDRPPASFAY